MSARFDPGARRRPIPSFEPLALEERR
jgi:hypothetical protein